MDIGRGIAIVLESRNIFSVGEIGMGPANNSSLQTMNSAVTSDHGSIIQSLATAIHIPDWLLGAIGGAVFTQMLTVAWDFYKRSRDRRNRDQIFLFALVQDLSQSKEASAKIRETLQQELAIIESNQTIVPPVEMIYSGIHDFLKMNIPKSLMTEEILSLVRDTSRAVLHINETIRSRERWRIHGQVFNNFSRRMRIYDEVLLTVLDELDEKLDKLTELITVKDKLRTNARLLVPQSDIRV